MRHFDTAFGTREFTGHDEGGGLISAKAWEAGGWRVFLNSILQPVIDSNIREVIAEFDCRQLVSSCALFQNRINQNLSQEIKAKLGQAYFRNIRFSLGPVELPGVQKAIDQAQVAALNQKS